MRYTVERATPNSSPNLPGHRIALDDGQVGVSVAAYGLDDDAFEDLREQWTHRWTATAQDAEVTT